MPQGNLGVLTEEQSHFSQALAHYVTGLIYRTRDERERSLEELERVAILDPSRQELQKYIVQEYFRKGDFKKAADLLEVAVQREPESVIYWSLLAVAYRSEKLLEKASAAAERAIQLDPLKLSPYEVLFEIAMELPDFKKARKTLDRAVSQESEDPYFWMRLAEVCAMFNEKETSFAFKNEEIIQLYDRAISLTEKDDLSLFERAADFYERIRNYDRAKELYQQVLAQQPNTLRIQIKLALNYLEQGNKDQAITELEKIVEREPSRYQVLTLIAELYEEAKNDDRALANYRLSLSVQPRQLDVYLRMTVLELKNKHYTEAIHLLDTALERFPDSSQLYYFYGLTYSETKEYPKAIESFEKTERLAQDSLPQILDGFFYFYYGAALERAGQFDQAVEKFKKAIEINPDHPDACNYLGFMLADRNTRLDEAVNLIEKALSYEPENAAFLDSMGWAYFRKGNFEKALFYLLHSSQIIQDDSLIFDHIGDVYRQMGKHADALRNYQRAMELDPKNKEVNEKLENIKRTLSSTNSPPPSSSSPFPSDSR